MERFRLCGKVWGSKACRMLKRTIGGRPGFRNYHVIARALAVKA